MPVPSMQASVHLLLPSCYINSSEARMSRAHDKAEGQVLKTNAGKLLA